MISAFPMTKRFVNNGNSQLLYLLNSDFHKIDSLIQAKDRIFEINICSKFFFLSKEQIFLISNKAYLYILETQESFNIIAPPNISENLLLSCFQELFSLLSTKSKIKIYPNNMSSFLHLSKIFEISSLYIICQNVISSGEPQSFFLSSETFHRIPKDIFGSLNDFRILLNDCNIECNRIFASLISNKIFTHIVKYPDDDLIDFSSASDPEMIRNFFNLMRGKSIWMNETNKEQISNVISFLEYNSVSSWNGNELLI
jgi:hypothetical protein